ncbi:GntR family transcriptional regulator [Gordonia humi]|uniref:DNA-binding GntR family transcriptional regulator n=1 Tax=Gordonia humi TaxID=686429 RepID=A0A840F2N5_9ACTN|nr:DNA-binding GntR family transcriptional regulator [Gordonia humi]
MAGKLAAVQAGSTLAERTYQALRDSIELGRLLPGERITERALASSLGVSPTPVREAIRRLEQERLIERTGPRTVRVSQPTTETLHELAYTEACLRAIAARFATTKISDSEVDHLQQVVDRMEKAATAGETREVLRLASEFDQKLQDASGNEIITALAANVTAFGPSRRWRAVNEIVQHDQTTMMKRLDDHRAILDALRAKDADRVEHTVRQHIMSAADYFITAAVPES